MIVYLLAGAAAAAAAGAAPLPRGFGVRAVCPPAGPGRLHCDALEASTAPGGAEPALPAAGAAQTPECHIPLASEGCDGLRPQDLHRAYELPAAPVSPQTIAIIAAGGDPTIRKDLANYDREFGLEACPGEEPCPQVVNGEGNKHPLPAVEEEAPLETSLDVEVAHGVCPGCRLLLVEAASDSLSAVEEATDTAARLGADEISISYGGSEPNQAPDGGAAFDHPGVVITASAGDTGYLNWDSPEPGRPEYPASSPDVIAVGGTTLELGASGEWQGERIWDLEPATGKQGGGSGCSTLFGAPSWQRELPDWEAVGCGTWRATADIAAIAGKNPGVAVYDSTHDSKGIKPGWQRLWGTSVGTPLIAAAWALAGGAHGVAYPAQTLYENAARDPALLHDVTAGTNGECARLLVSECTSEEQQDACAGRPICVAGPGYDGPSGLGSLDGIGALEPPLEFRTRPPSPARRDESFPVEAVVEASGDPAAVTSATPAVCEVTGGQVSLLAAGTCTLVAAQPGYLEARQSFAVERTPQQVGFSSPPPADAVAGGASYQPAVQSSSGLPVTVVSLTPAVCAVQGDAIAPLGAGTCTISAEQAGDGEYEPAPAAIQSYVVAAAPEAPQSPPAPSGGALSFHQEATPFARSATLRLRSARAASRRSGSITLTLAASPGGTLRWSLTFPRRRRCRTGRHRCAPQVVRYAAGSEAVSAGPVTLTLRPSAAARRMLRAHHPLRVRAQLELTTASGAVAPARATVSGILVLPR